MNRSRKPTTLSYLSLPFAVAFLLFGVRIANAAYPDIILGDNPVAYYRLEEISGNAAIDSSTNQLNGNYLFDVGPDGTFPTLGLPGIDTNSIFFKYYTDTNALVHFGDIDIPFSPLMNPAAVDGTGNAFSAEIWVQPTVQPAGGPNDYRIPFSLFGGYGSGIYGNASGWNFYQSPGPGSFWILNVHQAGIFAQISSIPIQLLNWYHLAVTFDRTNFIFYINGAQVSVNNGVGYLANPGADAHIGTGANVGFNPFDGGVDEAAVYAYTLTPAQILAHYQSGTNSFRAVPTPPAFLSQPSSTTNYSGTPVTFSATASGSTPLSYQWLRGTNIIAGATSGSYTFTAQYPADNGASFSVTVTNAVGKTNSSAATLSVLTNVNVYGAPTSITRNSGSNSYAAFRVAANGALPISYQWHNGTTLAAIPGATNATLWLKGLTTNDSYYVTVSNPFMSTNLPAASLTVQTRPVNVPITKYAKVVVADSPVAYWRLDELAADNGAATDAVGSFDGTYNDAAGSFIFGAPTGIPHETDGAVGLTNGANIQIPFAVELNSDTAWSAETWVQPYSLGVDGNDYRVVLSSEFNLYPNPYNGWYVYQQPQNNFAFAPQPGNGFIVAGPNDPAHGNQIVANNWYHLVITDDGTTFTVYVNGEARSSFPVALDLFIPNGTGILPNGTLATAPGFGSTVLGQRTDAAFGTFIGAMDDTAIYNYALSAQQVQLHYLATVKLTIAKSGSNIVLSWPTGTLLSSATLNGTYLPVAGATSPYTTAPSAGKVFYRVQVQ